MIEFQKKKKKTPTRFRLFEHDNKSCPNCSRVRYIDILIYFGSHPKTNRVRIVLNRR